MIHPITFSIPLEKVIDKIPTKTKILSDLIPGKLSTYIYTNESDYYAEYQKSYFATTTKKAGWDCMRHYEIIANACIPYFPDIESCPPLTMALLPKDLLIEGNALYKVFITNSIRPEILDKYNILVNKFLEYTRSNLTTTSIARYILEKTKTAKNILYLSGSTFPDYLRCLVLHGFKSLLGSNCHDYPKIPHIYKADGGYPHLYGKGITYTNLLDNTLHSHTFDTNIRENIENRYFDLIIYGSYHRGMPLFELVNQFYKPNEIVMLCGEDIHDCNYMDYVKKGYSLFVREL
jgi:hypothetical protein